MGIIERVKGILLKPQSTWQEIKTETTTIKNLYTSYAGILAIIPPLASLIGMSLIGVSFLGMTYRTPFGSGLVYAIVQYILSLIGLYVLSMIINMLAPHFASRQDMVSAMKVAVYSYTPSWIASILFIIPALSPIAMILSLYSLYLIYVGLPILMETPKEKTLVYFIVVIIVSLLVFFLVGMIAALFLPSRGMPRL